MYRRNKYEGATSVYFFSETKKLFQVNQNGKRNIMHQKSCLNHGMLLYSTCFCRQFMHKGGRWNERVNIFERNMGSVNKVYLQLISPNFNLKKSEIFPSSYET